jgi:hypothetical protein
MRNEGVQHVMQLGDGVIIIDAGGGVSVSDSITIHHRNFLLQTIDLSAYQMILASNTFEEIALPECKTI